MGVVLKPHNLIAYKKVVEGFETRNKVAVVEPPGTGKSFIALKWIEENQEKKTLILVPSYSIILQYEEHIQACGYEISNFQNLQIMTYSTLMSKMKSGTIPKMEHIILDEFHRCGATEWNKAIEVLLETNSSAKILGLSATPIRYLDRQRDMSDELFDGNVVFQMDLTEAVARGILHFPFYITGIYKLDEDIKRYEKKISRLCDVETKSLLTEQLELAKRKLEKATKLEDLFSKYVTKKDGKIILFCKDKKHMEKMKQEAFKWFSKVNPEIDIYSVCYGKSNNEEELKTFYNSNNSHLKLLYCIDMLNEGFHIPAIDGVVMLRPTISPNLFMQQLGRGLALNNENIIIYDIVNNVRSNQDIKEFIKKVQRRRGQLTKDNQIDQATRMDCFEILEETREVFDTLKDIENMLKWANNKEYKIHLIEEFYKETGRLPKYRECYKGVAIGAFLTRIKQGQIQITEEQMNQLIELGFQMKIKNKEEEIENKIKLVEEFYGEMGRLPKYRECYKEIAIGTFLTRIKQEKSRIAEEQMNRLVVLGFQMKLKNKEEEKENKIRLVEEFYKETGRLPKHLECYKGVKIGSFLFSIKQGHTEITETQMNRLTVLGFVMEIKEEEKENKIKLIEEFYRETGRLPKIVERYKGVAIGTFLNSIKYGKTKIAEAQMNRLLRLGFIGQINDISVENGIQKIEQFYERYQRLPNQGECLENEKIKPGDMLLSIRIGNVRITEKQFLRLQQMDISLTREQVKFYETPHVYSKK